MPGFRRVYTQYPGDAAVSEIESVDVVDSPPPGLPLGAGTGTILVVGEFENGVVNRPMQVFNGQDQLQKFGGLGFPTATSKHDGAVARRSGGNEVWNGNGAIFLRNKRINRLVVCRVNNAAGQVSFRRLACLTGASGPFSSANGDSITFELNGGAATATGTTTGAKAQIDASGATYPVSISGLTLEIVVDGDAPRLVTFSDETSIGDVVSTINAVLAQDVASDNAGQLRLESVIAGGSGYIQVVGGTARAILGLPTAIVQQVSTFTVNNATSGDYVLRITMNVDGQQVAFNTETLTRTTATTTQLRDAFLVLLEATLAPNITFAAGAGDTIVATADDNIVFTPSIPTEPAGGDVTVAATTPPAVNAVFGTGNVRNLANWSTQEIATILDAETNLSSNVDPDGNLRVCNTLTPASGTLAAISGPLVSVLGFAIGTVADAADGEDVTIPAGTIVEGASPATRWVTLNDIETGTPGGPWSVGVRPWDDIDTAQANGIGTVTTIVSELADGFSVTNDAAITRLSMAQLDSAYATALDSTLDLSSPAADADFVVSARASASIMRKLNENAIDATANGMAPRKAFVRPPIGTSIEDALATMGSGVAADRGERRQYCFPGVVTEIPEIKTVGPRGGIGFSADGLVQVGSDGFAAAAASMLAPEENIGQKLSNTNAKRPNFLDLEDAYNSQKGGVGLQIGQYITFRANGITAPRMSIISGPIFQSDVTSVNRSTDETQSDAARRRLADYIIKSLVLISAPFVKKLNTPKRRIALFSLTNGFLRGMQSPDNADFSRIADFQVVDTSTDTQRAAGIQMLDYKVVSHAHMLSIVLRGEVGASVKIDEA